MLNALFDIPEVAGSPLAGWAPTADEVLRVCNERFNDGGGGPRWSHCLPLNALFYPGQRLHLAVVLLNDPQTPMDRFWPKETIVSFHLPVSRPSASRGVIVEVAGRSIEAYRFPDDRRLRSLRHVATESGIRKLWRQWLEVSDAAAIDLKQQLLRYLPGHKFVARIRDKAGQTQAQRSGIALRVCRPPRAGDLAKRHKAARRALRGRERALDVPRLVGSVADRGVVAVEWIKGDGLLQTLSAGNEHASLVMLAAALFDFHQMAVSGLPSVTPRTLARTAELSSTDLSAACPELRDLLTPLLTTIHRRLRTLDTPRTVTLHHDLHFDQVRVRKHRCTLVDLERMAVGDPLVDVANFVLQMRMLAHRPQFGVAAPDAERWAHLFLEQWQRVAGPVDSRRLALYSAIAALSLARGLMRHLRPNWRSSARQAIAEADRLMQSLDRAPTSAAVSNP